MAEAKQTRLEKESSKRHPNDTRMLPQQSQNITKEKLKSLLPKKTTVAVTDEIMELIYNMENDTGLPQELLEEDLMSYTHLLSGSTNGMKELVNAIKFCNLKRNYDNKTAWSIVFPEKYDRLLSMGKDPSNHVSMYNNSKLVVAIDKEMLIPVHLQYSSYFHAAVKKQFQLMNGKTGQKDKFGNEEKVSAMVQHLAAKELANLTAQPVETKIDMKITPSDAALSAQSEMNEQLKIIVEQQKRRLMAGENIIDVQEIGIDFSEVGKED